MAVQLLKAGANPNIKDHIGLSAALWLEPSTPKKKELANLIKKARMHRGSNFWDSEEVKAFIEERENDVLQCDNCGTWADEKHENGESNTYFQRCAKCKKVYCEC